MNLADSPSKNEGTKDCPRGRELCNQWYVWHKKQQHVVMYGEIDRQRILAWQKYRQHVDECAICKELAGD